MLRVTCDSCACQVSYNLVLNATRSSSTNPEAIVMQSFFSFLQTEEGGGVAADTAADLQAAAAAIHVDDEPLLAELALLQEQLAQVQQQHSLAASAPDTALPFLVPGRVVWLCGEWGHGVVLAWHKRTRPDGRRSLPLVQEADRWVCDVLVFVARDAAAAASGDAAAAAAAAVAAQSPAPGWNSAPDPSRVAAVVLPFLLSCV